MSAVVNLPSVLLQCYQELQRSGSTIQHAKSRQTNLYPPPAGLAPPRPLQIISFSFCSFFLRDSFPVFLDFDPLHLGGLSILNTIMHGFVAIYPAKLTMWTQ